MAKFISLMPLCKMAASQANSHSLQFQLAPQLIELLSQSNTAYCKVFLAQPTEKTTQALQYFTNDFKNKLTVCSTLFGFLQPNMQENFVKWLENKNNYAILCVNLKSIILKEHSLLKTFFEKIKDQPNCIVIDEISEDMSGFSLFLDFVQQGHLSVNGLDIQKITKDGLDQFMAITACSDLKTGKVIHDGIHFSKGTTVDTNDFASSWFKNYFDM